MKKRFLTIFYYKDIGTQHLYKDVGSIPLGLAKYSDWDSTFAYVPLNGKLEDAEYEKYVRLIPVPVYRNPFFSICKFLWNHIQKYDVLNFYHLSKRNIPLLLLAKIRNPRIKIYVKLDMGQGAYQKIICKRKTQFWYRSCSFVLRRLNLLPALCTVETTKYLEGLSDISLYKGRIKYLPNGFWRDESISKDLACKKEKIILTVGRLGTSQKNTELLLASFAAIPVMQRSGWNLVLVGTYTPEILQKAQKLIAQDESLKGQIEFIGNINDKKCLNQYYAKASIFCLPSRWEGSPLVLPEAMHHGCFPIVTDCCDAFYDILDRGRHGIIVPNENAPALTKALEQAMADKMATVRQGMVAKQYVDQHFDWEKIIYQLQGYLNNAE